MGPCKKLKSNKTASTEPLALTKGDLDEIINVVRSTTGNIWGHIENQYKQVLEKVK